MKVIFFIASNHTNKNLYTEIGICNFQELTYFVKLLISITQIVPNKDK